MCVFAGIDFDDIIVFHQGDQTAIKCFRRNMAHHKTMRSSAESCHL